MSCMSWVRWVLLAAGGAIALPVQACEDARWAECVGWPEHGVFYDEDDPATIGGETGLIAAEQLRRWRDQAEGDGDAALTALIELGRYETDRRRRGAANRHYERALARVTDDLVLRRRLHWTRAQSCAEFGDFACAREHWRKAASDGPLHPRWLPAAYAYGLWQLGNREQAVAWYRVAVQGDGHLGRESFASFIARGTALNRVAQELFAAWAAEHATMRAALLVELEIGPDGHVERVVLPDDALSPVLAERVQTAISAWRFEAPVYQGRAVTLKTYADVEVRGRVDDAGTAHFEVQHVSFGLQRAPGSPRTLHYPKSALLGRKEGRVDVRAKVAVDVTVEDVRIARSSGHRDLDDAVLDAVRHWTYLTESVDGVDVAGEITIPIDFRIDQGPALSPTLFGSNVVATRMRRSHPPAR